MPLAFFKDSFLPEEECSISIHDRAFRFGDGVFETLLVVAGRMVDIDAHLRRLQRGLDVFRIDLDISDCEAKCQALIARNGLQSGYVRIVVSRGTNGPGAVGYLPKGTTPYLMIQTVEKPYPAFAPIRLYVSSQLASVHVPSKTNNALIYTLAMMEADDHGCHNALLLDAEGHICETGSGNIFWIKDHTLYTPSLDLPLVPGTMRAKALELWNGDKQEGYFTLNDLQQANEIFMTNIATILAPVASIQPLGLERTIGEQTKWLRERLDCAIMQG